MANEQGTAARSFFAKTSISKSDLNLFAQQLPVPCPSFYGSGPRHGSYRRSKIADSQKTALFEQRFKTLKKPAEGKIATQIEHPNVVKTYEYGIGTDKRNYLVMEYLKGSGLHAMIYDRDSMLEGKRLELIRQFARALGCP